MKYLILLTALIPTLSWGMEGAKPIIKMEHKEFSDLLNKHYSSKDRFNTKFSHTIKIPSQGAEFALSTGKTFHPESIVLDLEKGTKSITIHQVDGEVCGQFDITNDSNKKLAAFWMIYNAK